ncbi:Vascular endothelial growth factor receptor 3 [Trachymyrmex cornetzi]|uniref:Vascular endothelial growth factor receptor 3 n=1 Tax=Trachymyrmex cornetzi TaxID=471704 RepID=A0A151J2J8_9HYME|nr:Vascular endothelial growth factor receptor 3 [Trachymyrmex cornetzi]
MQKLPEQQELMLQGPVYKVDDMGYISEDIPKRVNHYQKLKKKVFDDKSYPTTIHTIVDGALKGSDKRHMLRELDVCIRADSMKYLADLVEIFDMLYVVLELPLQILKDRLLGVQSGDVFPIDQILSISFSIAIALQYLASHKIIHNRLYARSVELSSDWTPKLMDHGIAKYALQDLKYARWTAIEYFDIQTEHQSGVIWAVGVLLWKMFSMGDTPYSNLALDSEVEDAIMRGIRLPQLLNVTDPIYEVMSPCWRDDPEERPTFDELTRLASNEKSDSLSICPITVITESYLPELELN